MNIQLAREIYGQPWFIDSISLNSLTAMLNHYKAGGSVESGNKSNVFEAYDVQNNVFLADQPNKAGSSKEMISVIKLNGAITKNGGDSSYGTVDLAQRLKEFDEMPNVIGHIIHIDSGGGSAVSVKYLRDAILSAKKPTVAFPEDLAASAAYYIATGADHIMANDGEALIGSIGTMIEFQGTPKIADNKETGERTVRVYADQSTDKNIEFEEAINNLNFKPIREKRLNPLNAKFVSDVLSRRPKATEDQLKGGVFEAKNVVGTLIDSIGTFEEAVNKIKELSSNSGIPNINLNKKGMTQSELMLQHPELCNTLVTQGVEQERKRVRTILKFSHIDAKACEEMVAKGAEPDSEFFADMQLKAISKTQLKEIEDETVEAVVVDAQAENSILVVEQVNKRSEFDLKMRASAGIKEEVKQ